MQVGLVLNDRVQRTINQLHQTALACTIGAQNSGRLTKLQVKVDVVEHRCSSEPSFSVTDLEPGVGAQINQSATVESLGRDLVQWVGLRCVDRSRRFLDEAPAWT